MINKVNKTTIYNHLSKLVSLGRRPTRSHACDKAAEYIYNCFKINNGEVKYQEWSYPLIKGKNVIADYPSNNSNNNSVFIVSAHYDTWWNTTGANDDTSGIAVILSLSEIISSYNFNHTIRFVCFSGHENFPSYTYGSTAYAKYAYEKGENIVGVINLDMIGNSTDEGNVIQLHSPLRSLWLSNFIQHVNKKYNDFFEMKIEFFINRPGADEISFIDYGYDSVLFIQSDYWKPPNHQPEDDISTIDFDFLTNATKMIVACIAELACENFDLQVRISKPKEDFFYVFDKPVFHLPGHFNLRKVNLRSMTYLIGGITIKPIIITNDEIKNVFFILDDQISYKNVISEPPYEFKLEQKNGFQFLKGRHKIGVKVLTYSGMTAYDEMDVIFI